MEDIFAETESAIRKGIPWRQTGSAKVPDRNIDLADACLIRLADAMGTADILTPGQDFQIYRWGRNNPFHVLPAAKQLEI